MLVRLTLGLYSFVVLFEVKEKFVELLLLSAGCLQCFLDSEESSLELSLLLHVLLVSQVLLVQFVFSLDSRHSRAF